MSRCSGRALGPFTPLLVAAALSCGLLAAQAAVVSSPGALGTAKLITFDQFNAVTAATPAASSPVQVGTPVGENVLLTGFQDFTLGARITALGPNGVWTAGDAYAGTNFVNGTLLFDLGRGFAGVGAFVNHNPDPGDGVTSYLKILDAMGLELDSVTLAINTSGGSDAGAFIGFLLPTASIRFLQLEGNFAVLDDLRLADARGSAPLPEPGSLALVAAALLAAAVSLRRARNSR